MNAGAIIYDALGRLHVIRPGQTAAPQELSDGLVALNNLVDSLSTDRLMIPYSTTARYALVAFTAGYTLGPSGTLVGPRPIRIDQAGIVQGVYNYGASDFRSPLEIIDEKGWAAITDKTATSDIPLKLYPVATPTSFSLSLWPNPNVSSTTDLELTFWAALSSFPDQSTDVPLNPGYARALGALLAIELSSRMPACQLDNATVQEAAEAQGAISKLNSLMIPEEPTDIAIPPATDTAFRPVPSVLGAAVRMSQPGMRGAVQAAQQVQQQK